jgi:hypothetical protein
VTLGPSGLCLPPGSFVAAARSQREDWVDMGILDSLSGRPAKRPGRAPAPEAACSPVAGGGHGPSTKPWQACIRLVRAVWTRAVCMG